ncbi:histidinol-phosphatase [Labrenzia sp. R5_0]|uniref:histidinol-phosphatase n=1 Tax=Labrenzia sp. R5_0 TaxID=2821108 RepID=UPI0025700631|nr:histidinol-phosphatase [Labrenzia sp. R5_0]
MMTAGPVSSSNLFAPFLDRLAEAASGAIMPHFRQGFAIDNKWEAGFDPVTIADKNGETAMRALINETYPDHGILGEEHGPENLDAEHVWVLDPIDGTRAFITGLPTWGTLIGLRTNGVPSLGMMVQPYIGERFGGDGKTAWYDGPLGARQLKTRPCQKLEDATIFTTTPALFKNGERQAFDQIEAAVQLSRYGTDCYAYCMVAAGHGDAVIESGLQAYDIVALVPIIEGAGGVVTTWTGGSPADGGQIVASGDPRLHEILLRDLAKAA